MFSFHLLRCFLISLNNAFFKLLNSYTEPFAVKAFSMTIIYNLTKKYPDIVPELKASITALLPNGSMGIKSRGNKILKAIQ